MHSVPLMKMSLAFPWWLEFSLQVGEKDKHRLLSLCEAREILQDRKLIGKSKQNSLVQKCILPSKLSFPPPEAILLMGLMWVLWFKCGFNGHDWRCHP